MSLETGDLVVCLWIPSPSQYCSALFARMARGPFSQRKREFSHPPSKFVPNSIGRASVGRIYLRALHQSRGVRFHAE